MHILFPGRHLVNTRFQEMYLTQNLGVPVSQLAFLGGSPPFDGEETLDDIIFAITSSNQAYSRYNPIPYPSRIVQVDRFGRLIKQATGANYRIFGVPDFGVTDRFAQITIQEIEEQSEGDLFLTPENTVVLCSTPHIIAMYQKLGFSILPAELAYLNPVTYTAQTPIDVVKHIAALGEGWRTNASIRSALAPSSLSTLLDFPEITRGIIRLYNDPILNDHGSITDQRDYDTYAVGMSNKDAIEWKYQDIKGVLSVNTRSSRIVDEGCADGTLLMLIARDFPDADLIGIDISGEFMARFDENRRAYRFGNAHVSNFQRNLMSEIFPPESIAITVCNSTGHELWSYGNQKATIEEYLAHKFKQTEKGGRLVMRDVVGPDNKDQEVYLWCNTNDGSNDAVHAQFNNPKDLAQHLNGLSTYSRFLRFAEDFLADMRSKGKRGEETKIQYRQETVDGVAYFVLSMKDAAEFMTTKDYTDNWNSELNEEFTFWSFDEWKQAVQKAGFSIVENPGEPMKGSRAYANPWVVENRFKGTVALYSKGTNGSLIELDSPVTNMVLVGEKR